MAKDAKQLCFVDPPLFCLLAVGVVGVREGAAWEALQEFYPTTLHPFFS